MIWHYQAGLVVIILEKLHVHTHTFICLYKNVYSSIVLNSKTPKQPRCPISGTKDKCILVYSYTDILDSSDLNELQPHASESQNLGKSSLKSEGMVNTIQNSGDL